MKTYTLMMAFLFTGLSVFAQDKDPKAKAVLDEVSKKIKSYTCFSIEFSYNLKTKSTDETVTGKATMKGDKYIVDLGDTKILCDGKTVWTIMHDTKEVEVNPVSESEGEFGNPTKLFSIWEKDFKYLWVKEEVVGGVTLVEIKLNPVNPAKVKKFHTVILKIDKAKSEINTVIVKGKDGETLTYKITKLTPNGNFGDGDFKFEKAKFPGYTVIN